MEEKARKASWILAIAFHSLFVAAAEERPIKILYISSYYSLSADTTAVVSSLEETLAASGLRADVFVEALDVFRQPQTGAFLESFDEMLALRYASSLPDIIVAQSSQALEAAARFKASRAPEVPVYCFDSLDQALVSFYSRMEGFYGRISGNAFPPTMRLAALLLPRTKTVYLLVSISTSYMETFVSSLASIRDDFSGILFVPIVNESFDEVAAALSSAGPDSLAILLPGSWPLEDGRSLSGAEAVERLSALAPMPYFGVMGSSFGTGLVGGAVEDRGYMGREAGEMIAAILVGPREPIPWLVSRSLTPTVDYENLGRFSISPSRVPTDTLILNAPPEFWVRYETPIKIIGLALAALLVLLAATLVLHWREQVMLKGNAARLERELEGMKAKLVADTRDAVLGRIALGLAHEINNPLAAIEAAAYSTRRVLVGDGTEGGKGLSGIIASLDDRGILLYRRIDALRAARFRPLDAPVEDRAREVLAARLSALGVAASRELADLLVDADLDWLDDEDLAELCSERGRAVLEGLFETRVLLTGLDITQRSVQRIAQTVEAVRSYACDAAVAAGAKYASVASTLSAAMILFRDAERGGTVIRRGGAEGVLPVSASPADLTRLWTGLIQNAILSMEGKGEIGIEVRREGEQAIIDVFDSGPGLEPEAELALSEPAASDADMDRGSRLGLSICKRIAEGTGGKLSYERREGVTRFTVRLPLAETRNGVS